MKNRSAIPLPPLVKHHFRDYTGSNHDSIDCAEWNSASYNRHPCDDLEPLDDAASPYREAAIGCLKVLQAMDDFLTTADDKRAGCIAVAIVLKLTSVRGLTVANIADQLGCSPTTINRYTARFARMVSDGGLQSIRPGSKSNGAEPVAVPGVSLRAHGHGSK
jgi:hypothetical protein